MPKTTWTAAADGRYWIEVAVGTLELRVMLDLGLVDPLDRVGFELEPGTYHQLKQARQLSAFRRRARRDASGHFSWSDSGLGTAQLLDATTRQGVGPRARLYISCGVAGVPNRVGIVFFHRLIGCRVLWELDQRMWTIEYP